MSTTTTSLSDSLSLSVPKLESTGMDWAIFSVCFQDAVEAKGFWGHFDGTTTCLVAVDIIVTATDGTTAIVNDTSARERWDMLKFVRSLLMYIYISVEHGYHNAAFGSICFHLHNMLLIGTLSYLVNLSLHI